MRRYHTPWFSWSIMMATHWTVGIMSEMFLIVSLEFGGIAMMTISLNLEIYLMGFIIEKLTNPHQKKKLLMVGLSKVLSVVYIRTIHLTKHSYNCFEESKILTKTTIMKQVIEEKKVLRSEIMARKEVNDEIQRSVSFIKDKLLSVIERNIQEGSKKVNLNWLHTDGLKLLLTMNPMEKLKNYMNKILENMTYHMDNKTFLCQYKKLDPLTARKGKWPFIGL